jgi:hypothetical protein
MRNCVIIISHPEPALDEETMAKVVATISQAIHMDSFNIETKQLTPNEVDALLLKATCVKSETHDVESSEIDKAFEYILNRYFTKGDAKLTKRDFTALIYGDLLEIVTTGIVNEQAQNLRKAMATICKYYKNHGNIPKSVLERGFTYVHLQTLMEASNFYNSTFL